MKRRAVVIVFLSLPFVGAFNVPLMDLTKLDLRKESDDARIVAHMEEDYKFGKTREVRHSFELIDSQLSHLETRAEQISSMHWRSFLATHEGPCRRRWRQWPRPPDSCSFGPAAMAVTSKVPGGVQMVAVLRRPPRRCGRQWPQ
ncbi:unnamed protein product [Phaeothamnion confervicola]